jgi:hypothetical protein
MSTFLGFEYAAFKKGLNAAIGNGTISKVDGARLTAAVTLRMTMYPFIGAMTSYGIVGLFTGEDDDDNDEGSDKKLIRSVVQTGIALTIGRGHGNATKAAQNLLIEEINERWLGALRDGDYDKYKVSLAYTVALDKKEWEAPKLQQAIIPLAGPVSPLLKSINSLGVYVEAPKKEQDAIERQEKKKVKALVDIAAVFGAVPLAPEINKSMNKWIYKDMGKKKSGNPFGSSGKSSNPFDTKGKSKNPFAK